MPEITIEYTSNVNNQAEWGQFSRNIRSVVSQITTREITDCTSRIMEHSRSFHGEQDARKGIVQVRVFIPGEISGVMRRELGSSLLNLLQTQLLPDNPGLEVSLLVEVADGASGEQFKFPRENEKQQ